MTTPDPETQLQLRETKQAYDAFSDVVNALTPIATDANDYPTQIANLAMQSGAGHVFANAVGDWSSNFNDIWKTLLRITAQLETQYAAMARAEGINVDLASGLPN